VQRSRPPRRHCAVIDVLPWTEVDEVYRRLRPDLVRLANLLTGSEALAEDVVQDAFVGFARHAAGVDNPDGYLRRSVVNLSRTAHRRRSRAERLRPERVTTTSIPDVDETWAALRRLPRRQRAALVLRFYEDLPFEEIGDLLGCPATTARSLAHRGLARLKEIL
jgi:RNA polymerase sigma factor (sigma-70 family)